MPIYSEKTVHTTVDQDGNEICQDIKEKTRNIEKSTEPEYIKIYTRMWLEFMNVPDKYKELFMQLALRMSYCNLHIEKMPSEDDEDAVNEALNMSYDSQVVTVIEPISSQICKAMGWTTKDPLMKGLKALCALGVIKKINRGVYQINPNFAGKGNWKYNPKQEQGGIEDFIAVFEFKDKRVKTQMLSQGTTGGYTYTHKQMTIEDIKDTPEDAPAAPEDAPEDAPKKKQRRKHGAIKADKEEKEAV